MLASLSLKDLSAGKLRVFDPGPCMREKLHASVDASWNFLRQASLSIFSHAHALQIFFACFLVCPLFLTVVMTILWGHVSVQLSLHGDLVLLWTLAVVIPRVSALRLQKSMV